MSRIGRGVREIRIAERAGAFHVIYAAAFAEAVYVLHAFRKKSRATAKCDLVLAAMRFRGLLQRTPNEREPLRQRMGCDRIFAGRSRRNEGAFRIDDGHSPGRRWLEDDAGTGRPASRRHATAVERS